LPPLRLLESVNSLRFRLFSLPHEKVSWTSTFGFVVDASVPRNRPSGFERGPLAYPRLGLPQLKSGRTSAPCLPQAAQTNRGSRSDSRTSSGHSSALIATQWLQRKSAQYTRTPRTPISRISPKVIFCGRSVMPSIMYDGYLLALGDS
jgi:hypothetical protein